MNPSINKKKGAKTCGITGKTLPKNLTITYRRESNPSTFLALPHKMIAL
jgi:hypothetical protein